MYVCVFLPSSHVCCVCLCVCLLACLPFVCQATKNQCRENDRTKKKVWQNYQIHGHWEAYIIKQSRGQSSSLSVVTADNGPKYVTLPGRKKYPSQENRLLRNCSAIARQRCSAVAKMVLNQLLSHCFRAIAKRLPTATV